MTETSTTIAGLAQQLTAENPPSDRHGNGNGIRYGDHLTCLQMAAEDLGIPTDPNTVIDEATAARLRTWLDEI